MEQITLTASKVFGLQQNGNCKNSMVFKEDILFAFERMQISFQ